MAILGEVFSIIRNGASIKQIDGANGFPITRIETISNRVIDRNRLGYANVFDITEYESYVLQSGDILMSHINSEKHLGKTALYIKKGNEKIIHGMNLLMLRANSEVILPLYAKYFFDSNLFLKQIPNITKKSVNQASFTVTALKKLEIKIPQMVEQKRIIDIMSRLDNIIQYRKDQLEKLDLFVKSRFIEMFGDVEESSKRWNTVYLEKVIQSIESGWSGNGIQRDKLEGEIAVLKVSAVTKGFFIPSECKVLEDQKNIKKYIYPHKDDLLFSRANTKEMVGATVIISKDFPELILPDKLWRIRFNELANIYFIKYVLSSRSIRNKLSSEATGTSGSMYNISMQKLKQLAIPLPPTDLQNNFAAFVSKIDKSK
ncbi:restriction endonuclease subunit S, partial [Phascolarctobacterium succinatutens]|uniref:restriction endonuclease subunit S n=1 Tax=Phascolarctobacterium succinatutens TaxID=626940 RepID=UPI0026ED7B1C